MCAAFSSCLKPRFSRETHLDSCISAGNDSLVKRSFVTSICVGVFAESCLPLLPLVHTFVFALYFHPQNPN